MPDGLSEGESYAEFLRARSPEEGLRAEIQFRQHHFESMRSWPSDHPDIKTFRYEDILGNERRVYEEAYDFYGASTLTRLAAGWLAVRYSAARRASKTDHIRNPTPQQWRRVFTPAVLEAFNARYGDLVTLYGYPPGKVEDLA